MLKEIKKFFLKISLEIRKFESLYVYCLAYFCQRIHHKKLFLSIFI